MLWVNEIDICYTLSTFLHHAIDGSWFSAYTYKSTTPSRGVGWRKTSAAGSVQTNI